MNKYKYLISFLLPVLVGLSLYQPAVFAFLPLFFTFLVVPVFELVAAPDKSNLTIEEIKTYKDRFYFDLLLYVHVGIYLFLFAYYLITVGKVEDPWEYAGVIIGMGILNGACVINLGHEFCHRKGRANQYLSELLLLMTLEAHFRPYHLRCHHLNVATPGDPATAKRGESIYTFAFREQIGSYFQAWEAEIQAAKKKGRHPYLFQNRMVVYFLLQVGALCGVYFLLGPKTLLAFFLSSVIGMFTLACASYIEHYGILRDKNSSGKYEPVQLCHSWNSDHVLGRILLFELTRHADHHYYPNKKYHLLDSMEESPQLLAGYPGSMLLAFIPPLWFRLMDAELDRFLEAGKVVKEG